MSEIKQDYETNIELNLYDKFLEFKNEVLSDVSEEQSMKMIESYIYLLLSR